MTNFDRAVDYATQTSSFLDGQSTGGDMRKQMEAARDIFHSRSTTPLSDSKVADRLVTLIDFACMVNAELNDAEHSPSRLALPELAKLLLDLRIPVKEGGSICQESVGLVATLYTAGVHFFSASGDDLSPGQIFQGLIDYAGRRSLMNGPQLLRELESE